MSRRECEMKEGVALFRVWGEDDLFFLKRYARRLAELIESFLFSRAGATS
jgi:hypothetical protein